MFCSLVLVCAASDFLTPVCYHLKKKVFRVHPVLSTVQHFQHTNCFKLVQQLDPLLAANSGYNHVSALGKP